MDLREHTSGQLNASSKVSLAKNTDTALKSFELINRFLLSLINLPQRRYEEDRYLSIASAAQDL